MNCDSSIFKSNVERSSEEKPNGRCSEVKNIIIQTLLYHFAVDRLYESSSFNENADAVSENDESNEWNESNRRMPLLFRGGFFRYIKRDGVTVRAECLSCKPGNVYSGHVYSSSNFLKHLNVSFHQNISMLTETFASTTLQMTLILITKYILIHLANASERLQSFVGDERR